MLKKPTLLGTLLSVVLFLNCMSAPESRAQTKSEDRLWSLLPSDTSLLVTLKNIKAFRSKVDASPLKKFFEHEGIQDFVSEISADLSKDLKKFRKEYGFKLEDLWNQFEGELAFTVGNLAPLKKEVIQMIKNGSPKEPKELPFTFLGYTKGPDTKKYMETLFEKSTAQSKKDKLTRSQHQGVEIMTLSEGAGEILHYAQQDNLFILGTHKKSVEKIIDRSWSKDPLSQAQGFKSALDKVGAQSDFLFYVNMPPINTFLQDVVLTALTSEAKMPQDKANRVIKAWVDCIGLDEIDSLAISASLSESDSTGAFHLGTKGKVKGLVKMLMESNKKMELPSYVPGDAVAFASMQINIPAFWNSLESALVETIKVIKSMNPGMPIPDNPLSMIEPMIGISIKNDVVDVLGSDIVTYTVLDGKDDGKLKDLCVFSLKNPAKARAALEKMTQGLYFQVDQSEYKGQTIFTMSIPGQEDSPSFLIQDDHLFAASEGLLKQHIDTGGKPASRLRDNETYKEFAGRIPKEGSGFGYWNPEYLGFIKQFLGEIGKNVPGMDMDLTNFPDGKFFKKILVGGINYTVTSPDGLTTYYYTKFQSSGQIK